MKIREINIAFPDSGGGLNRGFTQSGAYLHEIMFLENFLTAILDVGALTG